MTASDIRCPHSLGKKRAVFFSQEVEAVAGNGLHVVQDFLEAKMILASKIQVWGFSDG